MTMQFTWQGCDSILAAPLVLDLVRLVERAWRGGERGGLPWLACFFKSPLGVTEQAFAAAGCDASRLGVDGTPRLPSTDRGSVDAGELAHLTCEPAGVPSEARGSVAAGEKFPVSSLDSFCGHPPQLSVIRH